MLDEYNNVPAATLEEQVSRDVRRELVQRLLSDGQWHQTAQISSKLVGGSEGTRRLRELRALMQKGKLAGRIEKRKAEEGTQYEYRWVHDAL